MKPTKKLEAEMRNDFEAENLQLRDAVKRQAVELEKKKRELEIEAVLEVIRGRSMAMHHSDELKEVISVTFQKLSELNVLPLTVGIQLFDRESMNAVAWVGNTIQNPQMVNLPYDKQIMLDENFLSDSWKAMTDGVDIINKEYSFEQKNQYFNHLFANNDLTQIPQTARDFLLQMPVHNVCFFTNKNSAFFADSGNGEFFPKENQDIIKRAGKVFEQAYIRFLDLQKAEAQAREAQIEAALEKVRSRSMGMQKSEELREVIQVIYEQLLQLNFTISNAGFLMDYRESDDGNIWMTDALTEIPTQQYIPYFDHIFSTEYLEQKQKGAELFTRIYSFDEKNSWLEHIFKYMPSLQGELRKILLSSPALAISRVLLKNIGLYLFNYNGTLYTDEENATLIRFGKVFEQTYTRFLDLKKAEEQTREAQIEAGLERVRSRAMAMQTSEELNELIGTVFTELTKLDLVLTRSVILIYEGVEKGVRWWMANSEAPSVPMNFFVKYADMPFFNEYLKGWHERTLKWQYILEGENKINTDDFLFHETELSSLPDIVIAGMRSAGRIHLNASFNNFGNLTLASLEPLSNEHFDILLRFAKVFDLTYTRFNDLKQAEAQAREAKIEAALERVRSRTMGMQRSDELPQAANLLFQQIESLGIHVFSTGYNIWNEDKSAVTSWMSSQGIIQPPFKLPLTEESSFLECYTAAQRGDSFFVQELSGEKLGSHLRYMSTLPVIGELMEKMAATGISFPDHIINHHAFFSQGYLLFISYNPVPGAHEIFKRFAKVFEQTYTRFLDLQKAEAQAKEAQVEAALERVRARAMSMYTSEELSEVVKELRKQIGLLGQPELNTCVIQLYDESPDYIYSWASMPPGESDREIRDFKELPVPKKGLLIQEEALQAYSSGRKDYTLLNDKRKLEQWVGFIKETYPEAYVAFVETVKDPEHVPAYWSFSDFNGGSLLMVTMVPPADDSKQMLRRFSNVFGLAYRRFVDLKQAEAQAKEAKIEAALERVRSRTMAMQKSDELKEVIRVVCDQLVQLNILVEHAGFIIDYKERDDMLIWLADQHQVPFQVTIPYFDCQHWNSFIEAKEKEANFFANQLDFEEKNRFYGDLFKLFPVPDEAKNFYLNCPGLAISTILLENVGLYIENFQGIPYTDEENNTLMRFGKVFQQTYTRFLDLEKAEAQTRESQIQLALERARAQSMMMQHSSELDDTLRVFHEQVLQLGIPSAFSFLWLPDEEKEWHIFWAAWAENNLSVFKSKAINYPLDRNEPATAQCLVDWKSNQPVVSYHVPPREVANYFAAWHELVGGVQELKPKNFSEGLHYVEAFLKYGCFGVMVKTDLREDEKKILARFAIEFERTYTRFLDLQKAEAQAREAKIEAALEKVRSRSLAMHKTDELKNVINVVFEKLVELNIVKEKIASIFIYREGSKDIDQWAMAPDFFSSASHFLLPYYDQPINNEFWEAKEKGMEFFTKTVSFEEKNEMFNWLFEHSDYKYLSEDTKTWLLESDTFTRIDAFAKNSSIFIPSYTKQSLSEIEIETLKRFGKVFDQAYTRFLDLQKAEAQAKEAKIEAALERIRSRSLAMHHSNEIGSVVAILFEKLKELGVIFDGGAAIHLFTEGSRDAVICVISSQLSAPIFNALPFDEEAFVNNPIITDVWKAKNTGEHIVNKIYSFEQKNRYFRDYLFKYNDDLNKLPQSLRDYILKAPSYTATFISEKNSLLGATSWTEQIFSEADVDVLKRVARVFEQAYIRFLDLQKSEAQAREAQIQLALERVRARTMAMQKTDELLEVVATLYDQLSQLNFDSNACNIVIIDKDTSNQQYWVSGFTQKLYPESYNVPYFKHPYIDVQLQLWRQGQKYTVIEYSGKTKKEFDEQFFSQTEFKNIPQEVQKVIKGLESAKVSTAYFTYGALQIIGPDSLSDENAEILQRFAKVFDQTYTRFLDLQKSEAQARESQIQLALERVRARTMAMQHSNELGEAASLLFNQVNDLGIQTWTSGFNIWQHNDNSFIGYNPTPSGGIADPYIIPSKEDDFFKKIYQAKKEREDFIVFEWKEKPLEETYSYMKTLPVVKDVLKGIEDSGFQLPTFQINHCVFFAQGFLLFITLEPYPEAHDIFKRFGKVFEQTYTRFLDLQKAEAQARESQIEAALERVRSRTMGMQHSNELQEASSIMFQQIKTLGVQQFGCGFNIWDEDRKAATAWMSGEDRIQPPFKTTSSEDIFLHIHAAAQRGESLFVKEQGGDELKTHYEYMATIPGFKEIMEKMSLAGYSVPDFQIIHCAFFSQGYLMFITYEPVPQMHEIFKRFAKVFEQTYTRFLDLQKSEAQARQAEIELALERVRAKVMAMTTSKDLDNTSLVFGEQLRNLGIDWQFSYFWLVDETKDENTFWITWPDYKTSFAAYTMAEAEEYFNECLVAWRGGVKIHNNYVPVADVRPWLDTYQRITDEAGGQAIQVMKATNFPEGIFYYDAMMKYGSFGVLYNRPATDEEKNIQSRFAVEFERAYTRFLDLQKAEAQAREAKIEAGLERVRARTMAMQKSEELAETAAVVFKQLINLGIAPNRLYIAIINDDSGDLEFWITDEDGNKVSSRYVVNIHKNISIKKMYEGWKEKKKTLTVDMQGEELMQWLIYWNKEFGVPFKEGAGKQRRVQNISYFSHGFIAIASWMDQPEETISLLDRFAAVFNLTYTRFNDLKIAEAHALQAEQDLVAIKAAKKNAEDALAELQFTQKQLIQSEKMASLGELTAGIAHEIQNPLNFVNNFSDVSNELLEEMKEQLATGNMQQAIGLVNDVKQNLEKIVHHGKRADAIVKGMLQHSRTSSGQKEPTDINVLCDEYLRLAYHGLRAKDKSFNAKFETDFDDAIGKIDVIPQEIGRAILNMINNAFYAVKEKKKHLADNGQAGLPTGQAGGSLYEPMVAIKSKKSGDDIEIRIKDNGIGIPQKALDKIFQPFFTTKPTGQGTGLGLSLAYDIITNGHGGELAFVTEEGEGTEFIIQLPYKV